MDMQVISVKVTRPLYDLVERYLELDAHVTKSDFVRDAIREKLRNDTPWLLKEMFKNERKRGTT